MGECPHQMRDGAWWKGVLRPPEYVCGFCEMDRLRAELASTGWLLLGCALALEQIRVGVGQLADNNFSAVTYALTISERACEDLRELGEEVERDATADA